MEHNKGPLRETLQAPAPDSIYFPSYAVLANLGTNLNKHLKKLHVLGPRFCSIENSTLLKLRICATTIPGQHPKICGSLNDH